MRKDYLKLLKKRADKDSLEKISALDNPRAVNFIGEYVELCNPKSIFVNTDSIEDVDYIRKKTIENGEELMTAAGGHTVHFDGSFDQGRDKKNTRCLFPIGAAGCPYINSKDREEGVKEVKGFLKDSMFDREMIVCFCSLGPIKSDFSLFALQITDSFYVAHSESILYRPGYEEFKKNKDKDFFKFVHSAGELQNMVSKDTDKRRVYMDLDDGTVYSVNTQYAGNSVGLKKLALRLAINKASKEGWLAEHMFVMGVFDKDNKKAYFCGAYPSMCGKTSTAMLKGESIVGDDLAYLRVRDGKAYAVNAERGIFGIIKDINSKDDALLFKALTRAGEVIFSNVLLDDKKLPFWIGKDKDVPHKGINFSGEWFPGKIGEEGKEISPSHKNARYTIKLSVLDNADENLENPLGVEISGIIYGGRDSDTSVPVEESFSWAHGIITKAASLESETTAATIGQEGLRVFDPMSNIDFLSVPLGKYIKMNLEFGSKLKNIPPVFSVNYFLRDKHSKFLNDIEDKHVWLRWMRLRVDKKCEALVTPIGLVPEYEDLKSLFKEVLDKDYSKDDYIEQFTLRIPENLAKIERIINIYKNLEDVPSILFEELKKQEERLKECQRKFGGYVSPYNFKDNL